MVNTKQVVLAEVKPKQGDFDYLNLKTRTCNHTLRNIQYYPARTDKELSQPDLFFLHLVPNNIE